MEETLTTDMRIAAGVVKKIADENAKNPEILTSCKFVLNDLRRTLRSRPDSILGGIKLEAEERFALNRTNVVLGLMRNVNQYGDNDPEKEKHYAIVHGLLEEKRKKIIEGEENTYEKNSRR